jgi:superfamily I DNA/RNA helicase
LRKNYRNTFEILRAAYALIERYEFADADDDDFAGPSAPDYAKRRGERPRLVKCQTLRDEAELIGDEIATTIQHGGRPAQICVIGTNPSARRLAERALADRNIPTAELREDVGFESDNVKISTIESAKGHEFGSVYVFGLVEGALPHAGVEEAEMAREAARLYVAMTRARDSLCLSYNTQRHGPSRFLLPVQPFCDELEYSHGVIRPVPPMADDCVPAS